MADPIAQLLMSMRFWLDKAAKHHADGMWRQLGSAIGIVKESAEQVERYAQDLDQEETAERDVP